MGEERDVSELQRTVGQHAPAVEVGPSATAYVGMGILFFLFTALEIVVLNTAALEGVQKPLFVALMSANFVLSALYYQGLQHDKPLYKLTFAIGLGLGLLVAVSLLVLLQLGVIVR